MRYVRWLVSRNCDGRNCNDRNCGDRIIPEYGIRANRALRWDVMLDSYNGRVGHFVDVESEFRSVVSLRLRDLLDRSSCWDVESEFRSVGRLRLRDLWTALRIMALVRWLGFYVHQFTTSTVSSLRSSQCLWVGIPVVIRIALWVWKDRGLLMKSNPICSP